MSALKDAVSSAAEMTERQRAMAQAAKPLSMWRVIRSWFSLRLSRSPDPDALDGEEWQTEAVEVLQDAHQGRFVRQLTGQLGERWAARTLPDGHLHTSEAAGPLRSQETLHPDAVRRRLTRRMGCQCGLPETMET